jgi:hypothetical protein
MLPYVLIMIAEKLIIVQVYPVEIRGIALQ